MMFFNRHEKSLFTCERMEAIAWEASRGGGGLACRAGAEPRGQEGVREEGDHAVEDQVAHRRFPFLWQQIIGINPGS